MIADTDIKQAQSKLSFNTENSKQKPKKASASDINVKIFFLRIINMARFLN